MAQHRRLVVAAVLALGWSASVPARQPGTPDTVRERMHAYLSAYERELSTLVAEEHLSQWPMRQMADNNGPRGMRRDWSRIRTLVSDVAFVPLPGGVGWLGYRDVVQIGGRPVRRKGPALVDLLKAQTDDSQERAMTLLLESARHNLGAPRTINLPSLPLELLHIRNEARFVVETHGMDTRNGCQAMRLALVETVTPSLIQRPQGGNMPSRVTAWVEPDTGRLCEAEVRTKDAQLGVGFEAVVRVAFKRDPALDLLVPVKMEETFFNPPRGVGEGEATYSNYRRFTTSARLVPGSR